ncbi:hypothetical protein [Streptomyces sp. KS 21]|uniref:hypothetical protein n=1 Tax=Streptomyces sp. KS 21 TaxID=2485150 RepID=UPI001FBB74C7|nr:hypothetical protein [Streptomyces sp. KS 21]
MVFTVLAALSGMEREYIRDRTLEGPRVRPQARQDHRRRGRHRRPHALHALHLRKQEMSLRDIAARLVITTGKKKGQNPSPATVMRMLREHDQQTALREPAR